jgi:hypothetical protein
MADETTVKVRLDTEEAESRLSKLVRGAAATGSRVASTVSSAVGRGLGLVGMAGGVATGLAAIRGATESGYADVIGESLHTYGAQLEKTLLGDLGMDARASAAARQQTIEAFGMVAGRNGSISPGAKVFYDSTKTLMMQMEQGKQLFETNKNFAGAPIEDVITRIATVFKDLTMSAVDYLYEKMAFWR